ncbi:Phage shock protein PspC (stress-responsive transcriptional regulator) [Actinokineospora iranica]|uniref:Phage shock protein PspC (Stress-responsive transcriptional regulator) n=2 Tax=Actinokineospora iranica TaxID=1271860 RepID=A0A1G6Z605_9PSEU|nr:Phage shock protein PspC (stress-responsive transcriptional regulator) [Actinokineospora iranica]
MNNAHGALGVEDTLKDFWATRPRRPRRGRKVAGVAAAIGNRYGMDPLVVRVAFVVATFYSGAGLLFYLLGWLFLAEEGDEASPAEALHGKGRSSTSTPFTIALCIALIPAFGVFFDRTLSGWLGLAVVFGLLFLLHRGRGHLGAPPAPTSADAPTVAMATPVDEHGQRTTPPAWDPLGAAPFAWDLPEPGGSGPDPEPPAPRGRSRVGVITLAAVFLTVGAAVLAEPYLGWVSARHVIGVVLAILGLGLVAGSFVRGGRGLIGLAMPLAALGIALTLVWPNGFSTNSIGDLRQQPTALEHVQPEYQRDIGSIDLDFTVLPASGSVKTRAQVDVGDVTVVVPRNADVTVRCAAGIGSVSCLGQEADGPSPDVTRTDDLGPDGAGGLKLDLDLEVTGPGSVEVRRG